MAGTVKVIAIVGMPGSGKSLLSAHLKVKGFPVIRFGEIVVSEVQRRGLEVTPLNERSVREEIRQHYGMDACARLALPIIRDTLRQHKAVVIDGLYSFSEYKTFREEFGDGLVVIAVVAPRKLRHRRLATREERPLTSAEAEERDLTEIEKIEKGGPIAIADFTLLNEAAAAKLTSDADELLATIFKEA